MDLFISTTSMASLTVSEQKITLQIVTGEAAVYYPSEAAQQPGLTMKAVNTWIGREQTVMLAGRTSSHRHIHGSDKNLYKKSTFSQHPGHT